MNTIRHLAAGLLLLGLLLAVPAMAGSINTSLAPPPLVNQIVLGLFLAGAIAGAVTVTYEWPVQGTTAPTALQMGNLSMVTAVVNFGADTDTIALITHNMQLGTINLPTNNASLVLETSCLFPVATWYYVSGGSNTTILQGSIVSSNVFAILKASAASSAGSLNVVILRPHTAIR